MADLEKIKSDVEAILVHSQDYPFDLNASALIKKWYEAKAPFIELFGNKTIWRSEHPIKVQLSREQRSRKFNEFISTLDEEGILTEDFETFLRNNEEGFFLNKVLLPCPSLDIKLGSKLSKNFKKFIPGQETTRWAQDIASRYIQENKIEGYLYFSVDPRDFLTLSENNENWWSCQSLDGDYRTGNLSYMTDETTFVAYLADNKRQHYKALPYDIPWYSKKWRMLIHTDRENCIYYNRQYPYVSDTLEYEVYSYLNHLLKHNFGEPEADGFKVIMLDKENAMLPVNQITLGGRIFSMEDIVNTHDYLGYCDIVSSSAYAPILSVKKGASEEYRAIYGMGLKPKSMIEEYQKAKSLIGLKIGNKIPCPCCGEGALKRNNSFLCPTCIAEYDADEDFFIKCGSCYHRIYDEDEIYFIDETPYCKECYNIIQQENKLIFEDF
jgi:hypothetical protein